METKTLKWVASPYKFMSDIIIHVVFIFIHSIKTKLFNENIHFQFPMWKC